MGSNFLNRVQLGFFTGATFFIFQYTGASFFSMEATFLVTGAFFYCRNNSLYDGNFFLYYRGICLYIPWEQFSSRYRSKFVYYGSNIFLTLGATFLVLQQTASQPQPLSLLGGNFLHNWIIFFIQGATFFREGAACYWEQPPIWINVLFHRSLFLHYGSKFHGIETADCWNNVLFILGPFSISN